MQGGTQVRRVHVGTRGWCWRSDDSVPGPHAQLGNASLSTHSRNLLVRRRDLGGITVDPAMHCQECGLVKVQILFLAIVRDRLKDSRALASTVSVKRTVILNPFRGV